MTKPIEITEETAARLAVPQILRLGGAEARVIPGPGWIARLREELGLSALRKLRLEVQVVPMEGGLRLTGRVGATVVQPCVITLDPVTTRIDADIARTFLDDLPEPDAEEAEMPEDESLEPLGPTIDLAAILAESLSLNLPLYPRSPGAELGEIEAAPEGAAPIEEEKVKPFAGLEALKGKLADDPESGD